MAITTALSDPQFVKRTHFHVKLRGRPKTGYFPCKMRQAEVLNRVEQSVNRRTFQLGLYENSNENLLMQDKLRMRATETLRHFVIYRARL
jgi:hypothetical protein